MFTAFPQQLWFHGPTWREMKSQCYDWSLIPAGNNAYRTGVTLQHRWLNHNNRCALCFAKCPWTRWRPEVETQGRTAARCRQPNWKRAAFQFPDTWRRQRGPWLILHFPSSSAPSVFPTVSKSLCLSPTPAFYRSAFPDCCLIGAFLPGG